MADDISVCIVNRSNGSKGRAMEYRPELIKGLQNEIRYLHGKGPKTKLESEPGQF